MRTSNKILLALIIIVFTVPFIFATTISRKVKKNEYTVEKTETEKNERLATGTVGAFKAIKVIAPHPALLVVHVKESDKMNYSYYKKTDVDSITFSTVNDTLIVRYTGPRPPVGSERNWEVQIDLNLNVSSFNHLVVDGAVVFLETKKETTNNMSINIKNRGEVKDVSEKGIKDEDDFSSAPRNKKVIQTQPTGINSAQAINNVSTGVKLTGAKTGKTKVSVRDLMLYKFS
ncbi:MAG TPA: hypothetical protein VF623_12840 [Segetibacter sp.]|jgi:hypothetical protein